MAWEMASASLVSVLDRARSPLIARFLKRVRHLVFIYEFTP